MCAKQTTKSVNKSQTNQVRVIAGSLRGSKVQFADGLGLRPTSDRTRETLFNWLGGDINGARCLDLFAGSGILSFEALSRGAEIATAIDTNRDAIATINREKSRLQVPNLSTIQADALAWLASQSIPHSKAVVEANYDIVFIDPPFAKDILQEVTMLLDNSGLLSHKASIYVEQPSQACLDNLPGHWKNIKEKTAGAVRYALFNVA